MTQPMIQPTTQPPPPAVNSDQPRAIHLTLFPVNSVAWRQVPWDSRFARLLKLCLRSFGFRAQVTEYVDADPKPAEVPNHEQR